MTPPRPTSPREERKEPTFWNGEPCTARKVRVVVADEPAFPAYWARGIVGQEREAVEVSDANQWGTQPFYIDNEAGEGWLKVTEGRGGPSYSHRSITVEKVLDA